MSDILQLLIPFLFIWAALVLFEKLAKKRRLKNILLASILVGLGLAAVLIIPTDIFSPSGSYLLGVFHGSSYIVSRTCLNEDRLLLYRPFCPQL